MPLRSESYKFHCNRTQLNDRRQRIKRWQASLATPSQYSQYNTPTNSQHNTSQNDSGYFPSPNADLRTYLSHDSVYSLPSTAITSQNSSYGNQISTDEMHQWRGTYYAPTTSNSSYSSGYYNENGRTLLSVPYSFPHVEQNQVLLPRIDFSSDDFSVFSG